MNSDHLFIYGFGPYQNFDHNITTDIVELILETESISTRIYETQFDAEPILSDLNRVKPNIVIGLGQSPRAEALLIESSAKNLMCRSPDDSGVAIQDGAALVLPLSLHLPLLDGCELSDNAGTYVCNFSMWTVESWCRQNQARSGFVHVPFNYSTEKAAHYIRGVISTFGS